MGNTTLVHRVNNHQGCIVIHSIIVGAILMTQLLKGLRLGLDFGSCNCRLGADRFLLLSAWINYGTWIYSELHNAYHLIVGVVQHLLLLSIQ